jgi:hypothetical protein
MEKKLLKSFVTDTSPMQTRKLNSELEKKKNLIYMVYH